MKKIFIISFMLLAITGCSTRIADLTVASTKNFNLNSGNLDIGSRVTGSSTIPVILFPLGQPNLKEAIDNAVEKDRCAVGLSNVVIYYNEAVFIFGTISLSVKGNLILDNSLPSCGGYSAPTQRTYTQQPAKSTGMAVSNKENQLEELRKQNLPYDEYQRRYQQIMNQ